MECESDENSSQFFSGMIGTTIAALIGGTFILTLWQKWLREKSYGKSLLYMAGSFTILFWFIILTVTFAFDDELIIYYILNKEFWFAFSKQ